MALQFLYSLWYENETENTLFAASEKLEEDDRRYILQTVESCVDFGNLTSDEENEDLANTLYLRLPSDKAAIVRFGIYSIPDQGQERNVIIHAYIAEEQETVTPLLYAINNCFKIALTKKEQQYYLANPILPSTPFPRPQFKLSQAEIRKFFSPGRLKTLACLLQAAIDSYENERIILLNDKPASLKYWFYGLHCCLPDIIKEALTYSTYTFLRPHFGKLICGAPNHQLDVDAEIEAGHFVIDNMGGATCEGIEYAKYADYIVHKFWEDATAIQSTAEGIDRLMRTYSLSLPIAAGVLKLTEHDFAWFDSVYDIQYFLGKLNSIDKALLQEISLQLWMALQDPAFKFKLDESALPLVSYIFKSVDGTVKKEIIEYIDNHHDSFGIYAARSLKSYYADIHEKLGFINEYLPSALIDYDQFDAYREYQKNRPLELCILLYIIVDDYYNLSNKHGAEVLEKLCLSIYTLLLEEKFHEAILEFCRKTEKLPESFVRQVIVTGTWSYVQKREEKKEYLDEELIFSIMEEIISKPKVAVELLKIFARTGKYSETTLSLYSRLCANYPEETAEIDMLLTENDVFFAFSVDMALHRFVTEKCASIEELTQFFLDFYLSGRDRNQVFEGKLESYLTSLLPVRQIEVADSFLHLLEKHCKNYASNSIAVYLASCILDQDIHDILDYYGNNQESRKSICRLLAELRPRLSPSFFAANLCIDIRECTVNGDEDLYQELLSTLQALSSDTVFPAYEAETADFWSKFFGYLLAFMAKVAQREDGYFDLACHILPLFYERYNFEQAISLYIESREGFANADACALMAAILIHALRENQLKSAAVQICLNHLKAIPMKQQKATLRSVLSYAKDEEDRTLLKELLTELYYSDLTFRQKLMATKRKKLFE